MNIGYSKDYLSNYIEGMSNDVRLYNINADLEYEDDYFDDLYGDLYGSMDDSGIEIIDPYEKWNRRLFDFNKKIDGGAFQPIAVTYNNSSSSFKKIINNFINNLSEPRNVITSLLQGNPGQAIDSFGRFVINTTLGLGGIVDVAADMGYDYNATSFGELLKSQGVGSGSYLVLPLIGPSSMRDVLAFFADALCNPLIYFGVDPYFIVSISALSAISVRAEYLDIIEELDKNAIDPYAKYRSLYAQKMR